ncbi:MAG: hypothetical protein KBE65_17565 [Phycisphaerae bacterium]|nr:hypothetical protein [Phycisphaerae bacterium]
MSTMFPLPIGDAATIILVAVFLIVFVTTYHVLRKMRLYESPGSFVLAGCVALLSVLGLLQFTAAPPPMSPQPRPAVGHNIYIELILLPYAALAVAIVLMTLLAWISRRFRGSHRDRPVEAGRQRLDRSGVHGPKADGELTPKRRCPHRVRHIQQ